MLRYISSRTHVHNWSLKRTEEEVYIT